jgi:predicted enzyme related to lactoylglutathione lyase
VSYQIEGMTIAVTDMNKMVEFYSQVFDMQFVPFKIEEYTLFAGKWDSMNLLFCPAELAQNKAKQNRHQFDVVVDDMDDMLEKALKFGGSMLSEKTEDGDMISSSVYDPDNNSIVFKHYTS